MITILILIATLFVTEVSAESSTETKYSIGVCGETLYTTVDNEGNCKSIGYAMTNELGEVIIENITQANANIIFEVKNGVPTLTLNNANIKTEFTGIYAGDNLGKLSIIGIGENSIIADENAMDLYCDTTLYGSYELLSSEYTTINVGANLVIDENAKIEKINCISEDSIIEADSACINGVITIENKEVISIFNSDDFSSGTGKIILKEDSKEKEYI